MVKFQNLLDFVSPKEEGASTQTDEVKKQFKEFLDKLLLFVEQPNITEIENEIKLKTSNEIFDEVLSSINNFSSRRNKDMWIQKKKLFEQEGFFQGNPNPLKNILPDSLYDKLDQETIWQLVRSKLMDSKTFHIAKPTEKNEKMKEVEIEMVLDKLYIERSFISTEIDTDKLNNWMDLQDFLEFEETDEFIPLNETCNPAKTNTHFIKEQNGKKYWIKSKGNTAAVWEVLTNVNEARVIHDFNSSGLGSVVDDTSKKIKLIWGEPGQGKSVALSHIAKALQNNPKIWIEKIAFLDISRKFENKEISFENTDSCLTFLIKNCLKFSNAFDEHVLRNNIQDLVLILDGMDEINSEQREKSVVWLKGLSSSQIGQILISARTELKEEIEEEFGFPAYFLKAFSSKDMVEFLLKYWKHYLGYEIPEEANQTAAILALGLGNTAFGNISQVLINLTNTYLQARAKQFAQILLEHLTSGLTLNSADESFTGNALILKMIAETYKESARLYIHNPNHIFDQMPISLIGLYKKFTAQKFDLFLTKILPNSDSRNVLGESFLKDIKNKLIEPDHQLLALDCICQEYPNFENILAPEEKERLKELKTQIGNKEYKIGIVFGLKDNRADFMHKTFAEYFAAQWFVSQFLATENYRKEQLTTFFAEFYFTSQSNFRKLFSLFTCGTQVL